MEHTYTIIGMHCASCIDKIKKALSNITQIESSSISLNPPQAKIKMKSHVPTEQLNNEVKKVGSFSLAEEYFSGAGNNNMMVGSDTVEASALKTYYPLVLVFLFIILLTFINGYNHKDYSLMNLMNSFMGGFFLVFSFFKLLDVKNFAVTYSSYDIVAKKVNGYGYVYPFVEFALGIAFLTGFQPLATNIVTVITMSTSAVGVFQSLLNKRKIKCACLGAVFNLPMTTVTLVEDLLMVIMAAISIFFLTVIHNLN